MTKIVAALVAAVLVLLAVLIALDLPRARDAAAPADALEADGEAMGGLEGVEITAELVREVCEREIVLRSDLPFTEFPRPGTPEYTEPLWVIDLEAWVWVVELVYEEGMALRREWECRVTGDGRGLLRRNY
jgi:hypothetical protein